jgi:hypothetical protein
MNLEVSSNFSIMEEKSLLVIGNLAKYESLFLVDSLLLKTTLQFLQLYHQNL